MTIDLGYIVLAIAWLAFATLHSLLVATPVEAPLRAWLRLSTRDYRRVYVSVALVTFLASAVQQYRMSGAPIIELGVAGTLLGWAMVLGGLGGAIALFASHIRLGEFLGAYDTTASDSHIAGNALVVTGMYAYVRHPLSTFTYAVVIGAWFVHHDVASTIMLAILGVYLDVGTRFEEAKLIGRFGDRYRAYQRAVPRYLGLRRHTVA